MLHEKTDFSAFLLDESPDAVIATRLSGDVVFWSQGAEAMFGYTALEAGARGIVQT